MWPLGSTGLWQSDWCAKVVAEVTGWALLLSLTAPPLARCSPTLTFGPEPIYLHRFVDRPGWVHASFGDISQLHASLCCNRAIPDLHTGAEEKKRISAVTPLHCHPCYHATVDFSSGVGSSSSFRLSQPCFAHNTFSIQQTQFHLQKEKGLCIMFIICKN